MNGKEMLDMLSNLSTRGIVSRTFVLARGIEDEAIDIAGWASVNGLSGHDSFLNNYREIVLGLLVLYERYGDEKLPEEIKKWYEQQ